MEKEIRITRDIVKDYEIKTVVDTFNKIFPHGAKISEITKLVPNLGVDYSYFAEWLLEEKLTFNETILEFDTVQNNIFHNGNVHVKSDVNLVNTQIDIMGSLKIDGKLIIGDNGSIYSAKDYVNADEIHIPVKDVADAAIFAHIKTKILNSSGLIMGNVDADEVLNGGLIRGNVNTITIENINGGLVTGNTTFKLK